MKRHNIDAVCFDMYSTLVHEASDNPFYRLVADELGYDFEVWFAAYRRRGRDSMIGHVDGMPTRVRLAGLDIGANRPADVVSVSVNRHFPAFVASITLDPEAVRTLIELRARDLLLALVSNASTYSESILDNLELRFLFHTVVFSYRIGRMKPDPKIYLYAANALAVPATACAFVGDGGDRELSGARSVGMRTILVERDLPHTASARAEADIVVKRLTNVASAISRLENVAPMPLES